MATKFSHGVGLFQIEHNILDGETIQDIALRINKAVDDPNITVTANKDKHEFLVEQVREAYLTSTTISKKFKNTLNDFIDRDIYAIKNFTTTAVPKDLVLDCLHRLLEVIEEVDVFNHQYIDDLVAKLKELNELE